MSLQAKPPLTRVLLMILNELGEAVVDFTKLWAAIGTHYGSAYGKGGSGYVAELKKFHKQADLKRKLSELERRKFILIKRQGRKFSIALTDKGKSYNEALSWSKTKPNKSGWLTVVIFDIPEQLSAERRQWRRLLKTGGFRKLQQSVWVSKLDCYDLVAYFVKKAKVDRWVNVFRATDFLKH